MGTDRSLFAHGSLTSLDLGANALRGVVHGATSKPQRHSTRGRKGGMASVSAAAQVKGGLSSLKGSAALFRENKATQRRHDQLTRLRKARGAGVVDGGAGGNTIVSAPLAVTAGASALCLAIVRGSVSVVGHALSAVSARRSFGSSITVRSPICPSVCPTAC